MPSEEHHRTRALWLCTALHAFTHLYVVALLPLYLLIERDFRLSSVAGATFLMTALGVAYCAASWPVGVLSDRLNRRLLLGGGLMLNGLSFVALAWAPSYPWAVACCIAAGIAGSFYHPAGTAMLAELYPADRGKAMGRAGIGAAFGFWFGPTYAGWRAETAGWRAPMLELGLIGIAAAVLFFRLTPAQPPAVKHAERTHLHPERSTAVFWGLILLLGLLFSLRDFAGSGMGTLSALYMQRAWDFDSRQTGGILGGMYLAALISNPLFGVLSERRPLRTGCGLLAASAALIALIPWLPKSWLVVGLAAYGFFFLANYPVIEAALMTSVPVKLRGQVIGLLITVCGVIGSLAHWMVGERVDLLKHSGRPDFVPLFSVLAGLIVVSLLGLPLLNAIRRYAMSHHVGEEPSARTTEDTELRMRAE